MKNYVSHLLALTVLTVLIVLGAEVHTDYDHAADFAKYKTYSWINIKAGDPLWTDRIARAIDNELTAKGWSKVDSDGDAGVAAFGSTREQPVLRTFYESFGGGWFWHGFGDGMATTTVQN